MGQKNSKHRKSGLPLMTTVNFSDYYTNHNDGPKSGVLPQTCTSPGLNGYNDFGYIKTHTLNISEPTEKDNKKPNTKKISIDTNLFQSAIERPREIASTSHKTQTLSRSAMTISSNDLHFGKKKEVFQIKNVFKAEKFDNAHNINQSFFQKLSNKTDLKNPKISLNDMLNYKPGRRIYFTHTQQIKPPEQEVMKNPFEEIRVPVLEKKQSCFNDDMALGIEKNDKITPEERNLPSPYYQIKQDSKKTNEGSDEKIEILLEESDENQTLSKDKNDEYLILGNRLIDRIKEANEAELIGFEKIYEDYQNEYRLQIFMKTYVSKEKNRINIFRNQFIVPCSPETFLRFMNDIPEQTKIDTHLDKFYIAKELKPDLNMIYLSYKKVLISSPRELIYIKLIKQINKEQNIWCDASQSIEHIQFPVKKEMVRAEIILSGHMVSPMDDDPTKSIVRLYSEVDFKTNVPIFMSKSFSINEMKRYTGECIKRIKQMK